MRIDILAKALQARIAPAGAALRVAGCWPWIGTVDPKGYGHFNGRYAHRVAWGHVNGPIPPGQVLHHICGIRHCVRPDHLEPKERGTHIAEHQAQKRAARPIVTDAQRRERNRQTQRAWQAKQRLRSGCRQCVAPALPERTYCRDHLDAERAYKQRRALAARPA